MSACTPLVAGNPSDHPAAQEPDRPRAARPSAGPPSVTAAAVTTIDVKIKLPSPTPLPTPAASLQASIIPVSTSSPSAKPMPSPTPVPTPSPQLTPTPLTVIAVAIAPPASAELTTHAGLALNAQISLSDPTATDKLVWSSDHPEIASVSEDGAVTSYRAGEVTIAARSGLDPAKQDSVTLKVVNPIVHFPGQIVYIGKGGLFLMDGSNENPRQLSFEDEEIDHKFPRLSWDGSQVVYQRQGREIYTVASSGDEEPRLRPLPRDQVDPLPYFTADGTIVYIAQGDPDYGSSRRIYQIDGDNQHSVYTDQIPSGLTLIGGVRPDGMAVYEAGGVLLSPLDDLSTSVSLGSGGECKIAQNDNANLVVYAINGNVKTVTFGGQRTQLTTSAFYEAQPALSPDESKIVFISNLYGKYDLFMMNSDGTGVVDLTNTPDTDEFQPDWGH
ncbi:MAG: Ig-like domain-containing protein [Candidatus Sericytochromatia bacterium]